MKRNLYVIYVDGKEEARVSAADEPTAIGRYWSLFAREVIWEKYQDKPDSVKVKAEIVREG